MDSAGATRGEALSPGDLSIPLNGFEPHDIRRSHISISFNSIEWIQETGETVEVWVAYFFQFH